MGLLCKSFKTLLVILQIKQDYNYAKIIDEFTLKVFPFCDFLEVNIGRGDGEFDEGKPLLNAY